MGNLNIWLAAISALSMVAIVLSLCIAALILSRKDK